MYRLTLKQIKELKTDLSSKYSIYLNQELEELMKHTKSYMEIWNALKYCETVNDYEEQLKYVYKKALDKVENGSSNWRHEWLQVASDVLGLKAGLLEIKLDYVVEVSLRKIIDKVLKESK